MVVVVWGKCPTPCKKGGRIVRAGEKSGVTCPWDMSGGNIRILSLQGAGLYAMAISF